MDTALTTLLNAAGGAFLGKFVGPAAEHLGKAAWERVHTFSGRAITYLASVGREPQPVEPKLLVPMVQGAALETDETLAEQWAALLANAADPAQQIFVHPSFIDVMRHLTSDDAQILLFVRDNIKLAGPGIHVVDMATELSVEQVQSHFSWAENRTALSFANLKRLTILSTYSAPLGYNVVTGEIDISLSIISLLPYGRQFLAACTPPLI